VLGNASTLKTPAIADWLATHPRFVLPFTTSSSWLNLVERWFGELTSNLLRRKHSIARYCDRINESRH